jgi:hypothetical protein
VLYVLSALRKRIPNAYPYTNPSEVIFSRLYRCQGIHPSEVAADAHKRTLLVNFGSAHSGKCVASMSSIVSDK